MPSNIIELFPIPVSVEQVDPKILSYANSLKDQVRDEMHMGVHAISHEHYILNLPEFVEVKNYLTEKVSVYMDQILNIDSKARITQSWVNCNMPGQFTHPHPHPNSIVSGVFYLEVPTNSGDLVFHRYSLDNGTGHNWTLRPKFKKIESKYVENQFSIKLNSGDLVLFPSYLLHSVPRNNSGFPRWNVAFNSVTVNSFGDYTRLTEMTFT